ncbi:hypothetical protein GJ744_006895 [Endocarpon pusillum]|uniref:Uncharacterized protein n=1 Tax=Endocarpon pusillum TaxID=364733 RepID=A0A8H7AMN4_9EURO|nr:hypothetical protein GJ744_006895 [Endocarpon pusillum]
MNKAHLAFLILLPAVLAAVLLGILLQWLLMKREQRRVEDLVELRAKSQNESVTAVGGSKVDASTPNRFHRRVVVVKKCWWLREEKKKEYLLNQLLGLPGKARRSLNEISVKEVFGTSFGEKIISTSGSNNTVLPPWRAIVLVCLLWRRH